jgi:hypothetical protein
LGVANGTALPGTACNDGNSNTGNDTWNANCECIGQLRDCEGVPGGSSLPGTSCNDGNPFTNNDHWDANCNCVGALDIVDCAGVPGGTAWVDGCGICAGGTTGIEPDADSDSDGLVDCQDNCSTTFNPAQADYDGDGIGDQCDNCVWLYNPDQADANGNGQGDVCELATAIDEVGSKEVFMVLPNPAIGPVHIVCTFPGVTTIEFYTAVGERVMKTALLRRMDTDALATGVYIVLALNAEGRPLAQSRFVKQ